VVQEVMAAKDGRQKFTVTATRYRMSGASPPLYLWTSRLATHAHGYVVTTLQRAILPLF